MMIIERNNVITLVRGDSLEFCVEIIGGKFPRHTHLKLDETCRVYFGLMEPHQLFEEAILKKVYTGEDVNKYGQLVIDIEPTDTVNLEPGVYYYAVKLCSYDSKTGLEYVDTIIQKTKFIIVD